jgi:hypothetical protein
MVSKEYPGNWQHRPTINPTSDTQQITVYLCFLLLFFWDKFIAWQVSLRFRPVRLTLRPLPGGASLFLIGAKC